MGDITPREGEFTSPNWAAITPSDTAKLEPIPRGVFVGSSGDVVAVGQDGVSATFAANAGDVLPIQPTKIMATSTTATGLIALY